MSPSSPPSNRFEIRESQITDHSVPSLAAYGPSFSNPGQNIAVFGLASVFATIGLMKFTAPGWEPSLGGFPFPSVVPGQFLIKDLPLLGIALWALGDALTDLRRG